MSRKPKVIVNCVASHYTSPDERIVEFVFSNGEGGLIAFHTLSNGKNRVDVYRQDPGVVVVVAKPEES